MTFLELKAMADDELRAHIRAIVMGHESHVSRRIDRDGHNYDRAWFVANERGLRDWFLACIDERETELRRRREANYETMRQMNSRIWTATINKE